VSATKKRKNIFILGCRGAGKTTFLAGLAVLSEPKCKSPFQIVVENQDGAKRLTDLQKYASEKKWPAPTQDLLPFEFELSYRGKSYDLSFLDYPGEDLLEAMETLDFANREKIQEQMTRADLVLVVTDPTQDLDTPLCVDRQAAVRRQNAIAQAVGQLVKERQDTNKELPCIAMVVTKIDLLEAQNLTVRDVALKNQDFRKQLDAYAKNAGAIDCHGIANNIPESLLPRGYEQLFDWISQKVWWRDSRKSRMLISIALCLIVVGGLVAWSTVEISKRRIDGVIKVEPLEQLCAQLSLEPRLHSNAQDLLDKRLGKELEELTLRAEKEISSESLADVLNLASQIVDCPHLTDPKPARDFVSELSQRVERTLWVLIKSGDCSEITDDCRQYLKQFPTGSHWAKVQQKLNDCEEDKFEKSKANVRQVVVNNQLSLQNKINAITGHLKKFPSGQNGAEIRQALQLARRLVSADRIKFQVVQTGHSMGPDEQLELVWNNHEGTELKELRYASEVSPAVLDKQALLVPQQWGGIKVEMTNDDGFWDGKNWVAFHTIHILRDLQQLDGKQKIVFSKPGHPGFGRPECWVKVIVSDPASGVEGWRKIKQEELEAYGKFIAPGDQW